MLNASSDYQRAVDFAQGEEKGRYVSINEKMRETAVQNRRPVQNPPQTVNSVWRSDVGALFALHSDMKRESAVRVIMLILVIVFGIFLGLMSVGFIAVLTSEGMSFYEISVTGATIFFIGCVPFYFSLRRYRKAKCKIQKYRERERAFPNP